MAAMGGHQPEGHSVARLVCVPLAGHTQRGHGILLLPDQSAWLYTRVYGQSAACWGNSQSAW